MTNSSPLLTICGSNDRVDIHDNFIAARNYHADNVYPYYDNLFKKLGRKIFSNNPINDSEIVRHSKNLSTIVDDHVTPKDTQYQKAKSFVEEFAKTGKVEPLFRLFTLETPFYKYINQDKQSSDYLSSPIYDGLYSLRSRAFKGQTYRGLSMTLEEMESYRLAAKKPKRFLMTNTFCSTTLDIIQAKFRAEAYECNQRKAVLMKFNFPKECLTAIQLYRISDQLPCISEIENEEEVLVLPNTSFLIESVQQESSLTVIYLDYYCLDQEAGQYRTMFAYNLSAYD